MIIVFKKTFQKLKIKNYQNNLEKKNEMCPYDMKKKILFDISTYLSKHFSFQYKKTHYRDFETQSQSEKKYLFHLH